MTSNVFGIALMPGALIIAFSMPLAGKLSDRFGPKLLAIAGIIGTAACLLMLRNLKPSSEYTEILWPLVVRGLGVGFLMAPITAAAMNALPREKIGMGSGMINLLQQLGGAVGIAYVELLVERRMIFHTHRLAESTASGPGAAMAIQRLHVGAAKAPLMLAQLAKGTAAMRAFDDAFMIAALIVAVGLIPALFLRNIKAVRLPPEEAAVAYGE